MARKNFVQVFKLNPGVSFADPWTRQAIPDTGIVINDENRNYYNRRVMDGGGEIMDLVDSQEPPEALAEEEADAADPAPFEVDPVNGSDNKPPAKRGRPAKSNTK